MANKTTLAYMVFLYLMLSVFASGTVKADEASAINASGLPEIKKTVNELVKIIDTKNFSDLKRYAFSNTNIHWINCGPTDGEPIKHSISDMIEMLTKRSINTTIYINGDPEIAVLDGQNKLFTIVIETEGWIDEYPFLDFSFEYSKNINLWKWFGVCYDSEPPLKYSKSENKFVRKYYRTPTLPRPGARVFKDRNALGARIREIIQFEDFDALSAYAVQKRVIFSECGQSVIVSGNLEGEKVVPVEKVINYLKKSMPGKDELKVTGREDIYTSGWRGEYPSVNFIMSETKEGWEWNQVVYCKTSHMGGVK
jgi:hypothetical protein